MFEFNFQRKNNDSYYEKNLVNFFCKKIPIIILFVTKFILSVYYFFFMIFLEHFKKISIFVISNRKF
jgi:hypothetical protein